MTWQLGQGVKTSPSHGENRGSIPLVAANNESQSSEEFWDFYILREMTSQPEILGFKTKSENAKESREFLHIIPVLNIAQNHILWYPVK